MAPKRTCECGTCSKCRHRDYMRGWYEQNAERHRETARASRARRLEKVRKYDNARGYRSDPQKARVRKRLWDALRRGEIARGSCMFESENDCKGRIEAHHPDYSKPLSVIWVCQRHHGRFHRTVAF